jgi:predicted lipoprotein with Yx(FWY)xxD motif
MKTRTVAGAALFAAVLAACGSSSSKSSSSSTTTTAASGSSSTSATAAPTAAPVVKTSSNSKFGTIVVDTTGATLYTLTSGGAAVPCTSSACVAVWPPLLLPSGVTSAVGSGVSGVATVSVAGGTQVTQGGLPLYRFAGDGAAGDAKGDGISSFGGTWHVVKVGAAAGGATTSSSTGGSGSGY